MMFGIHGMSVGLSRLARISAAAGLIGVGAIAGAVAQSTFEGPTQGVGISARELGAIDLGREIEGMEGRRMRMRYWTVQPDGVVPVHSHENRPAMIYFLEGEIVQHRSDHPEPETFGPGDVSIENMGVRHWWENTGEATVHMIAIDIVQDTM